MTVDETLDHITESLSDDQMMELVAHRGGCQCCISPPCYAHSEPLTMAEAKHLGWWPEQQAAQAGKGAHPDSLADMLPSHGAGHVPALSDEAIDRAFEAEQQAGKDVAP